MSSNARTILVADDEPDLLSEVTSYLRRRGQSVIEASCYTDARRAYDDHSESIALVLTDVRMPDGSGVDLARWVVDKSCGECRCLLMSGDFMRGHLEADLEEAGVSVLDKPFAMFDLYASVLKALGYSASPIA